MSDDDKFLSRWSRRKQEAREADDAPDAGEVAGVADPEDPDRTDAEILAEHGLKDPDEMDAEDDFSAFMNSAIPARLRNRALRKLWLSNPVLANVDALVDYGEDFTDAATVVENLTTAYKVGRGYIDKLAEGDGDAKKAPEIPEPVAAEPDGSGEDAGPEQDGDEAQPDTDMAEPAEPEPPEMPPRRQRMAFRF